MCYFHMFVTTVCILIYSYWIDLLAGVIVRCSRSHLNRNTTEPVSSRVTDYSEIYFNDVFFVCAGDFVAIVRRYSVSRPGDLTRRVRAK